MKIGIGVTTYNRREVFYHCYSSMLKYAPEGVKIVVVDDGSETPVVIADVRHEKPKGIAAAKNACLRLLDDCDHIFLFDDDVWPAVENWYGPYIKSNLNHLCFTFEHTVSGRRASPSIKQTDSFYHKNVALATYSYAKGCMLYIRKECLEKVGGFDERFGRYGYEHIDFSQRVFNAGLTPFPFMDVIGSQHIFHSMDYHEEVTSSMAGQINMHDIRMNKARMLKNKNSVEYINYK